MKKETASVVLLVLLCLLCAPLSLAAKPSLRGQRTTSQAGVSDKDRQAIAAFETRVREYVKLREQIEERLPKLSKGSTPEQIQAHKDAFQEAVRAARVGAKAGDLFTPDVVPYIRAAIKSEFKASERRELRQEVTEETRGVAIRVNFPYPETKELVEMPPTLLLKLPQLPKQVKYRFVREHLLLVDRENGLILDYMLNALT